MFRKILFFLKGFRLFLSLLFVALLLLVWFPLRQFWIIPSHFEVIAIVLAAFAVIFFVWHLVHKLAALKKEAQLKKSARAAVSNLYNRSNANAGNAVEKLTDAFDNGLAFARRYYGPGYLVNNPWYVIIGPAGAGKSTALQNSGLQLYAHDPEGPGKAGGRNTQNCVFWFASNAVLIDTAGQYMNEKERRVEWYEFLKCMKEARKARPINGVMVTLNVYELLMPESILPIAHAREIRARIDELQAQLEMEFPVYFVFSQCDRLTGFVEFFKDLKGPEAFQVLGCTLSREQRQHARLKQVFEDEFERLCLSLQRRLTRRLHEETNLDDRKKLFQFPAQFASAKGKLSQFIEHLFDEAIPSKRPVFRGFYFTSGTQFNQLSILDNIILEIKKDLELKVEDQPAPGEGEKRGYFLHDLFDKLIFPERDKFATVSWKSRRRQLVWAGVVALLASGIIGWRLADYHAYDEALKTLGGLQAAQITMSIEELNKLRKTAADISSIRLFNQKETARACEHLFLRGMKQTVLEPMAARIENLLEQTASTSDAKRDLPLEPFNLLALYKLITNHDSVPRKREEVLAHVVDEASLKAGMAALSEHATSQRFAEVADYYLNMMLNRQIPDTFYVAYHRETVSRGEKLLTQGSIAQRYLEPIISSVGQQFPNAMALNELTNYEQVFSGDYRVPAAYTREAWERYVKAAIENLDDEIKPNWVRGDEDTNPQNSSDDIESVKAEVRDLYFANYVRHWWNCLLAVRPRGYRNLTEAESSLAALMQGPASPLYQLFATICENTYRKGFEPKLPGKLAKKAKKLEGLTERLDTDPFDQVSNKFAAFHAFLDYNPDETDKVKGLLASYLLEVKTIHDKLYDIEHSGKKYVLAMEEARAILKGDGAYLKAAIRKLETEYLAPFNTDEKLSLQQRESIFALCRAPVLNVVRPLFDLAEAGINDKWQTEVRQNFQGLVSYYPFTPGAAQAVTFDQLSAFFGESGGVYWAFTQTAVEGFIETNGAKTGVKAVTVFDNQGIRFLPALADNMRAAQRIAGFLKHAELNMEFNRLAPLAPPMTRAIFEYGLGAEKIRGEFTNADLPPVKFTWSESNDLPVTLEFFGWSNETVLIRHQGENDWALFKFLDKAAISAGDFKQTALSLTFPVYDAEAGRNLPATFHMKVDKTPNPFVKGFFNFKLPDKICGAALRPEEAVALAEGK